MADKLLIRAYNVEVGDCIYCKIPAARAVAGRREDFHILIDCGSVGGMVHLEAALEHLQQVLPEVRGGRRRLDLLVVTHEHKDHMAGFDPERFEGIKIENLWMSAAMNLDHPQAERSRALHRFVATAMQGLAAQNVALSPELQELVSLFGIDNEGATEALRVTLPERNGITPQYVHAGMTGEDLGLELADAAIHILGPENDIDHFYLGEEADETLRGFLAAQAQFRGSGAEAIAEFPENIGESDFRTLRSRMLSNALAFADLSGAVTNNTSVVLLIEWRGKRLLFVGDAEWNSKFKVGKANGSWNVMWHNRRELLGEPVDFLKIGHHGSANATPWSESDEDANTESREILDAILPRPRRGRKPTAKALVSTKRKNYPTIPKAALLSELGRRVASARNYQEVFVKNGLTASDLPRFIEYEKAHFDRPQPLRTDCEFLLSGTPFVDVEIEA